MSNQSDQYNIQVADLDNDRLSILGLWEEGLGDLHACSTKYSWFYIDNPVSRGKIYLLKKGEEKIIVGVQGLSPREWYFGGNKEKIGLFADFVVDQNHRTLGPALILMKGVVEQGNKDYSLMYGFPNRKAEPVLKRAGYKKLGDIVRYVKILHSFRYLSERWPSFIARISSIAVDSLLWISDIAERTKINKKCVGKWENEYDERFEELWNSINKDVYAISMRKKSILNWRFSPNSGKQYETFTLNRKDNNKLEGYIICYFQNNISFIMDFLASDQKGSVSALLSNFTRELRKRGIDSISLEYLGDPEIINQIQEAGFHQRDSRSVFYVITDFMSDKIEGLKWYITAFDEDQ